MAVDALLEITTFATAAVLGISVARIRARAAQQAESDIIFPGWLVGGIGAVLVSLVVADLVVMLAHPGIPRWQLFGPLYSMVAMVNAFLAALVFALAASVTRWAGQR